MREPPRTPVKYSSRDVDFSTPDRTSRGLGPSSAYDYAVRSPQPARDDCVELGIPTPARSRRSAPQRSPGCEYCDRLVPSRAATDLDAGLSALEGESDEPSPAGHARFLRDRLLGQSPAARPHADSPGVTPEKARALFSYRFSPDLGEAGAAAEVMPRSPASEPSAGRERPLRKFPKEPFRTLFAPNLQDDFYQNCLSNSSSDVLAVGLGWSVELWSAKTERSTRLCEYSAYGCASLVWSPTGAYLAVGRHNGEVQVWDAAAGRRLRTFTCHYRRVGALAWNGDVLSTGCRDGVILQRDVRQPEQYYARLKGHGQEVCGLSWSPDGLQLASGGNEGHVCIWSGRASSSSPLYRFSDSEAAVRALAWSPHKRGLLACGGGSADKCIRLWSTTTGGLVSSLPTGSQVCNLAWSKNVDELVSTHGYSDNDIVIWRCPSMAKVATLSAHTARVLHLAMSADGRAIITGAGDETVRFWHAFPSGSERQAGGSGAGRAAPAVLGKTIR